MKRIVGGVEIDDHLTRLLIESADTFSDQQSLDLRVVGLDLVGASLFVVAQLQAVKGRGAGQRIALILFAAPIHAQRVALVCGHRDERVAPQRVMIVEILVTGGQAQHALGQELAEGMLDKEGLACVAKTGRQAAG